MIDEDCYGSIEVSVPVEFVVNAIATLYYGTGEDYEPNDFSCKIRYKYIQKLFFTYSVNTNRLVTITPDFDSYSYASIKLIYDSFKPLKNYNEEENCGKYGN